VTDPFSQPSGGSYPKIDDLDGSLLMFKPDKPSEMVPNRFAKRPEDPTHVARISVDTVVFGPDGYEEYRDMYWSQQVIINACEQALKPGAKPFVLGVLQKVGQKENREKLKYGETAEDFRQAYETWLKKGGKPGDQPRHVWILAPFSDEQAEQARAYIAEQQKARDPFATTASE
jgi:hypothetical protein